MNSMENDRQENLQAVGRLWDKYEFPPALNPRRAHYGHLFFTSLERFYLGQLDALPQLRWSTALDIGCGFGRNLVHLGNVGAVQHGIGIDVSKGAIDGATRMTSRFLESDASLVFRCESLSEFVAQWEGVFGLVMATQALGYFRPPGDALDLVRRLTEVGSLLVISDAQRRPASIATSLAHAFQKLGLSPTNTTTAADETPMLHHPFAVEEAARQNGFQLIHAAYSRHWIPYLIEDAQHWLWSSEYANRFARVNASALYGMLAAIRGFEDALLVRRSDGDIYWHTYVRVE